MSVRIKARIFPQIILSILLVLCLNPASAQESTLVQVKTFDLDLKPISNLEMSFDKKQYFSTGSDGSVIIEINNSLLPPKAIHLKDAEVEAESWNYSKGILEIIIRKKSYESYRLTFIDNYGMPLKNMAFILNADLPVHGSTDRDGFAQLAMPVDLDLTRPKLFRINGYRIISIDFSNHNGYISASLIAPPPVSIAKVAETENQKSYFDENRLDSLSTIPSFYAFIRELDMINMAEPRLQLLDDKFSRLMTLYRDSLAQSTTASTVSISDSSLLTNDIIFLTRQAILEAQDISATRAEFDQQIAIINEKITEGGGNLSDANRAKLLGEITRLDDLLLANEILFTQNQRYYKTSINDLKNSLLDIEDLENQLSEFELQRLAEQKKFQRQLFIATSITIGSLFLVFVFIYLMRKISRQKKELIIAHEEVKEINNNLEKVVAKRTKTLQRVNRELDTFLYRSSHDLKRPLSSIIGLANIAKITLNKEANDLFEKARKTADDMDRLLQKLITISQINDHEDDSEVHFLDIINKIHNDFKDIIDEKGAIVTYDIADNLKFNSNPKLVECILRNLVDNALNYCSHRTERQPKVEVSVYRENATIHLNVNDNGEGISEEIKSKIWNMFYRGNIKSHGNGLGLYIAKRAVNVLKGDISFETTSGKFTNFKVQLPITVSKEARKNITNKKESLEPA